MQVRGATAADHVRSILPLLPHGQVGLKGQPPILEGELPHDVKPDDCMWNLSDGKLLEVSLAKGDTMRWWAHVLKSEPEINTQKVRALNKAVREEASSSLSRLAYCSS